MMCFYFVIDGMKKNKNLFRYAETDEVIKPDDDEGDNNQDDDHALVSIGLDENTQVDHAIEAVTELWSEKRPKMPKSRNKYVLIDTVVHAAEV